MDLDKIPNSVRETLDIDCHISEDRLKLMEWEDVLREWLEWEGIIGYTSLIVKIVKAGKDKS